MFHSLPKAVAVLLMSCLSIGAAADDSTDGDASAKAVSLRSTATSADIRLLVKPVKPHFKVNENMAFRVQANRDYYLYVFTLDEATGDSVLLIPNRKTRSNHMSKDKAYTIPGTIDFYSDSAGYEKLVFIATDQPMSQQELRSRPFGELTKSATKDLEEAFSA